MLDHAADARAAHFLVEGEREMDRALRFRVDALLDLGEDNEKVQFDAVLQVATQVCSVR